uniref:exodeoxyribonuclease III n=1 Tax=Seriola lalandi dorsalis TaxID=1841481 RepID=A0A3B4XCE1_SERLL
MLLQITITSWNVRGISSPAKRTKILNHLYKIKSNICFLQETHLTEGESQKLTAKWINQAYHSVYNSKKRGTSILISKNIPFSHISTLADPEGCYTIVTGSIGKDTMTLANIYALSKFPNSCVILGGDFNITLDSHMDRSSSTSTNKSNRKRLQGT